MKIFLLCYADLLKLLFVILLSSQEPIFILYLIPVTKSFIKPAVCGKRFRIICYENQIMSLEKLGKKILKKIIKNLNYNRCLLMCSSLAVDT